MAAESKIQSKIVEYLTKGGFYCNKSIRMSRDGFPDILAIKAGVTYYFEIKAPGGVISPLQEITIRKINEYREIAFVVYSFQEFIEIWERL